MAEIKEKVTAPSAGTIVRTAALFIVLANQLMTLFGKEALPFTDEEIYSGVSSAATVIIAVIAWWKNNSFTEPAIAADEYRKKYQDAKQ